MSNQIGWYTMKNSFLDQGECNDDLRRVNCFYKKYRITQNLQKKLEIFHKIKWSRFKNVVAIYDYYQEDQETAYVFMEQCNYDLSSYNKNLQEKGKNLQFYKNLISQVSKGYLELKSLQILHRDIKPNNILVVEQNDTPIYKICDFDISKKEEDVQGMRTNSQQGTISYSAPEIKESKYSYAADMFSFGLTIFQLLAGDNSLNRDQNKLNSFYTQLKSKSFENILQEQKIKLNIDASQSLQIVKILNKMIVYQPDQRISWEDLKKNIFNLKEFDKNQVGFQQIQQRQYFRAEQMQDQQQVQAFKLNPQFNNVQNQFKGSFQVDNQNFNFPARIQNNNDQVRQSKAENINFNLQINQQNPYTPRKHNLFAFDLGNNLKSKEPVPYSPFIQNKKDHNQIQFKQNFINSPHQNAQQQKVIDPPKYLINQQQNQQEHQQSLKKNRSHSFQHQINKLS